NFGTTDIMKLVEPTAISAVAKALSIIMALPFAHTLINHSDNFVADLTIWCTDPNVILIARSYRWLLVAYKSSFAISIGYLNLQLE
ncbi:14418_t:CDS:2, partial [Funneliformis mosseae]